MNISFKQYADQFDYIEVLKVTIRPDGNYAIPSEKDGKIANVTPEERHRLREFLLAFCDRLECPSEEHVKKERKAAGR